MCDIFRLGELDWNTFETYGGKTMGVHLDRRVRYLLSKPGVIEYLHCKFFFKKVKISGDKFNRDEKKNCKLCHISHCGSWINATRSCS